VVSIGSCRLRTRCRARQAGDSVDQVAQRPAQPVQPAHRQGVAGAELVKDLLESLAASIIVYSDPRRRPAGARLAPGTGATASSAWTTAATTSRQRGLDHPERSRTGTGAAGSRAASWPVTVSLRDLGVLDGRRGTGIATTVVGAGRAGGHRPPGRLAPPPGERPGRAQPYSYPSWAGTPSRLPPVGRPTPTWRRGGGGSR
jgi:hypothetical protein